jgi:hypothetical protein
MGSPLSDLRMYSSGADVSLIRARQEYDIPLAARVKAAGHGRKKNSKI